MKGKHGEIFVTEIEIKEADVEVVGTFGRGEFGNFKKSLKGRLVVFWVEKGESELSFGFGFENIDVVGVHSNSLVEIVYSSRGILIEIGLGFLLQLGGGGGR